MFSYIFRGLKKIFFLQNLSFRETIRLHFFAHLNTKIVEEISLKPV